MPEKMMSLYDYLGKAAGSELGKQVYNFVQQTKRSNLIKARRISNIKYTGEVLLYPKYILDEFFNKPNKIKDDLLF
jgi:hypothetical protein